MVEQQEVAYQSWQELLQSLIVRPKEKRRLAEESGLKQITLQRWAKGESEPREDKIWQLMQILPYQLSQLFVQLLRIEYPMFFQEQIHPPRQTRLIEARIYAEVLARNARVPGMLNRHQLTTLIFEEAIAQLDPDERGMCLALVLCVRPRDGEKVQVLHQVGGVGTPPWERNQARETMFLGAGSLAGEAVFQFSQAANDDRKRPTLVPTYWTKNEESSVAYPLLRHARVAGALVASSKIPDYFGEDKKQLIEQYAHLMALLFQQDEFYEHKMLDLQPMPTLAEQEPLFVGFDRRLLRKYQEARNTQQPITMDQAREQAWQEIADELIRYQFRTV
jgi:transcriptional regulator with XRE-family HTH domain